MDDWKQLIYVCPSVDGGVSIIVPALDYDGTEEEWIELNELDKMERYLTLYPIQMPGDRYFRDAWELGESGIEIDLEKAKRIHIDRLCIKRNTKLQKLDVESVLAYETGSKEDLSRVIELKQRLRDMPTDDIFNVDDVEKLRNIVPDYLR